MIIMAVDSGEVRSGIAVCDKSETLASPVCVITEYNREKRLEKIAQKSLELKAEHIVVGLPKNMDGSAGERAQTCRQFAEDLYRLLEEKIPVSLCDERATTMLAHTYLSMNDVRGKKRKESVDAVSAVIILEDFIAMKKAKS